MASAHCLTLFWHLVRRELSRAVCTAGSNKATKTPIMAITTSSSTSVNPPGQTWPRRDKRLGIRIAPKTTAATASVGQRSIAPRGERNQCSAHRGSALTALTPQEQEREAARVQPATPKPITTLCEVDAGPCSRNCNTHATLFGRL